MTRETAAIATAADYADALLTARRAKNIIVLLLLLMVLVQIGLFFLARYRVLPIGIEPGSAAGSAAATTAPASAADKLHYLIGLTDFFGIILSILLGFVLLLIVNIMLVGRLIGIARLTSGYILSLFVALLLFPWQAFMNNATFSSTEFKIPGVLYTWDELREFALFPTADWRQAALKWARFVGLPVVAAILLLVIQVKSNRGLRQAFGDADVSPTTGTLGEATT